MARNAGVGMPSLSLIAKAHDRMEWDFLFAVLRKFGCDLSVISLIELLLTNCWFSVLFNDTSHGFFKSSRGLRQGDLIAPALFILVEEALNCSLSNLIHRNIGGRYLALWRCPSVFHLLFANDTYILQWFYPALAASHGIP